MGANVTVVDRSAEALRRIATQFGSQVRTIFSTRDAIRQIVKRADLLIGGILVPGAAALVRAGIGFRPVALDSAERVRGWP